jgi:DNA-binding Xre family transcriptional regulator
VLGYAQPAFPTAIGKARIAHSNAFLFNACPKAKVKGVRFETLEKICVFLDCQPGDLLIFQADTQTHAE